MKNQDLKLILKLVLLNIAIGRDKIRVFPIKAQIMAMDLPGRDFGVMSPYPTVVRVAMTSQVESMSVLFILFTQINIPNLTFFIFYFKIINHNWKSQYNY